MRKLFLVARCLLLLARNFILRRRLELRRLEITPVLPSKGSKIRIFWEVWGCHRISVGNDCYVPGNISGVEMIVAQGPVTVMFYGYKQTILRQASFYETEVNISISQPILNSVDWPERIHKENNNIDVKGSVLKAINGINSSRILFADPTLKELLPKKQKFEPFSYEEYQPDFQGEK